jgi:hypothetical protein
MSERAPQSRTSWIALVALAAIVIAVIVFFKMGLGQW